MKHSIGKHIFLQHPDMQLEDVEYYKRKKRFLEKANLQSGKKISFRDINKNEIEKSVFEIKHVVFEVTKKCNLNCVYCAYGELYSGNKERRKEKRNMKKEDAIKLLEHLYPIWKHREEMGLSQKIMIGFYGGEPLLNFPLIETIVQWAKEHTTTQLTFKFHLTTNGLLLNQYIPFLVKHNFILNISLDGDEENMAYRINHKGENCFQQVFHNLMVVKKDYPEFFDRNLFFLTVLHNKNSIEQACSFCITHFNKVPACSNLNDSGVDPQRRVIFSEMYKTIPVKISKRNQKAMMQVGIGFNDVISFLKFYSGFYFYDYNTLLWKDDETELSVIPAGVCIPFSRKIYMTINGNLYPCERIDSCYTMGNVHDTKVLDVEHIASRYNLYLKNISPVCTDCKNNLLCSKCLFHIDGIQGNKPQCNMITNQAMFDDMVASVIAAAKKYPELYRIIIKKIKY